MIAFQAPNVQLYPIGAQDPFRFTAKQSYLRVLLEGDWVFIQDVRAGEPFEGESWAYPARDVKLITTQVPGGAP